MDIKSDYKSKNFSLRKNDKNIDTIIIHYTGMKNYNDAISRLCDPISKVSAHYFINREGLIWQLVPDDKVAWHAGVSQWHNRLNLNETSLGIELCNPGHENKYLNFTEAQYQTLESLLKILMKNHNISRDRVLGHSDIAPDRKKDPGEKFNWRRLSKNNFAIWPDKILTPKNKNKDIEYYLESIGYNMDINLSYSLYAFKRHFIPHDLSLNIDEEVISIAFTVYEEFKKIRSLY